MNKDSRKNIPSELEIQNHELTEEQMDKVSGGEITLYRKKEDKAMKKPSQVFDCQKFQQNPKQAASTRDAESGDVKAVLSDDELGQVSAAGDTYVPTVNPEVLLGRHDIPADGEKRHP